MDDMFTQGLRVGVFAGLFAGLLGGLTVLVIGLLRPPRKCPECHEVMPKVRRPGSWRQAFWGGWTCPRCGCEIDRHGKARVS